MNFTRVHLFLSFSYSPFVSYLFERKLINLKLAIIISGDYQCDISLHFRQIVNGAMFYLEGIHFHFCLELTQFNW